MQSHAVPPPPSSRPSPPASSRSRILSWALWDWGSASFNAVIITFVFTPYLTKGVAASEESGSSALGWSMAAAGLVIALVAPAVGTRADAGGRHRMWLGIHTSIVVLSMLGLFFVRDSPEYLWLGLLLIAVGSVFFEFAEVSYNGIMVRITRPDNVGRVSGFGWGMGYVGGLVLLVLLLVLVIQPEVGILGAADEGGLRFRIVAALSALWFAVFALPVLFTAPGPESTSTATDNPVRAFLSDYAALVRRLVRMWREEHQTLRFFIASAVFRDGLAAIFAFAGVLAAGSYGFSASEIIVLGVAANIAAGTGAMIAGVFDDRFGPKPVIIAGLIVILLGGLPILFSEERAVFWACALILSFCVGPVQASSRSFLARITPPESAGENFGLYATTGRAVSFLGPAMFAVSISVFGFQRAGVLGILLVLLLGLILIIPVRPEAPRLAMQR
ncbi:UMF1 family MFS transporter [Brevibacterium sanguinis]|uniref:UMF1 family MFS transporter n=2 Tax=Brevibacterium TaxID=1696 RepID=A0A366IMU8_9MICO|nr:MULTISPECIES: MFS transporter [Brevibacterium]RBP66960.1 UMF1 family MFS transporter [Brevibacterium sanguinis]RBP73485.1 UMF1 family MFS transporter [Brevibacterium celere]